MTLPVYEKLGVFYLGRGYDLAAQKPSATPLLFDSKDLTTHGVIVGMTGSGKTGLGIGLLEEAALDGIPVIAIDPKGDLGNLLLSFPELSASDLAPWVNPQEAAAKGISVAEYAAQQAEFWRKGLADWDQDPDRIARLRGAADFRIYTPGGSAGTPISALRAFSAPPATVRADSELFHDHVQATVTSVLALLGIEADPLTSREHILLGNILQHAWGEANDLDLPTLIAQIQRPPISKIGVMDLESVYPQGDRFELAMQLNNLIASPGFAAWTTGVALDAESLLYGPGGKPQVSVISIAHLSDAERMFFVSMLLNEVVAWMREQSGTGSLRAILYMDEIFGFLPPVANPASKPLFLTLFKQARAFGLGVVVATQNPADLDYKALSNAGTWFIGRLQAERDKARLLEGLEGAASGASFDYTKLEQVIAGLGKRVFLLHTVHDSEPVTFQTRWTLSYLAGPLTREQIRTVAKEAKEATAAQEATAARDAVSALGTARSVAPVVSIASVAPIVPPGIRQFYLPAADVATEVTYVPHVIGIADVAIASVKYQVDRTDRVVYLVAADEGAVAIDWAEATLVQLSADAIGVDAPGTAKYAECPPALLKAKAYSGWESAYGRWLRANKVIKLWRSATYRATSAPDESERDFRIRLQQLAREQRDVQVDALRRKYATKVAAAQDKVRRAEQAIAREQQQASAARMDTAISVGSAVLGALFGRKKLSVSTMSRAGTAMRGATRAGKEAGDVTRASDSAAAARAALQELEQQVEAEITGVGDGGAALSEALEEIVLKPKASDVHIQAIGLAWAPFTRTAEGRLTPAWSLG